ncbi:MAG: DUF4835 family protein [Sphingobacteriales bacterium]|nr:DUF4835 family protein [Sphingobacteriales bacterium]
MDCNVLITILKELSPTRFEARFAIQSSRPVHNSSYNCPFLLIKTNLPSIMPNSTPYNLTKAFTTSELSSVIAHYI